MKKNIAKIISCFLIIGLVSGCGLREDKEKIDVTIKIWGTFESTDVITKMVNEFKKTQYQDVTFEYKKIPLDRKMIATNSEYDSDYEEIVFGEIAAGRGPDIVMIHNTWLPKHADKLLPITNDPKDLLELEKEFVATANEDLVLDGWLYSIPFYVDNLAMYYDKQAYKETSNSRPGETWLQFERELPKITKESRTSSSRFDRSGVALGTANNISRASDMVLLYALQSGVVQNPFRLTLSEARSNPLRFYTDFANLNSDKYTWNDAQDYYVDAFVAGDTASIVGYSYLMKEIESKGKTDYGVVQIPQINKNNKKTLANYWAPAISKNSPNPEVAFAFMSFMAGDGAELFYKETGLPPARLDLIKSYEDEPNVGVFVKGARLAETYDMYSMEKYDRAMVEAIKDVNEGKKSVRTALAEVEEKVNAYLHEVKSALSNE